MVLQYCLTRTDVFKCVNAIQTVQNFNEADQTAIKELNLSQKEKLEDFDNYFNVVTSSIPMLEDYEKLYGFSFADNYDRYRKYIADTTNDFDFFCVMSAIANEIPSCHNSFFVPSFNEIKNYYCYNYEFSLSTDNLQEVTNYWDNTIKNICESEKRDSLLFNYIVLLY